MDPRNLNLRVARPSGHAFGKARSGTALDHHGRPHPDRASQPGRRGTGDVRPAVGNPAERLRLMEGTT